MPFVLIFGIAAGLTSCLTAPPPTESELPGVYVLQDKGKVDSINVKADGTFEHEVWAGRQQLLSERGRWQKDQYPDGSPDIEFHEFRLIAPPYAKLPMRAGMWAAPLQRDWRGRIILVVNPDVHLYYRKADSTHGD